MAKELYHFHFRRPHEPFKFALSICGTAIAILGLTIMGFQFFLTPADPSYNLLDAFSYALIVMIALGILIYIMAKVRGGDVDESEFILYDNGWFAFWDVYEQVWIAPSKVEWIYPKDVELKPIHVSEEENKFYFVKKKKNGNYKVIFWLKWSYPDKKWSNWVFSEWVQGWLEEKEYRNFLEMIEYLEKKAKENLNRKK